MTSEDQNQSTRFLCRRNIKYDLCLLSEVNSKNPYAFNNQKPVWTDVANALQEGYLKMKVTHRSCRERVAELLKIFRRNELASIQSSGASEEEMSELKVWLTNVAKLEETKPNKLLKSLYSKKGRTEAEAIRAEALGGVENRLKRQRNSEALEKEEEEEEETNEESSRAQENRKTASEDPNEEDKPDETDKDFEFGPKHGRFEQPQNSKKDLIKYLEKTSEKEIVLRKEELRLREKEVENKASELQIMRETKEKELELARLKAEAEIEDKKKITDLLLLLATGGRK